MKAHQNTAVGRLGISAAPVGLLGVFFCLLANSSDTNESQLEQQQKNNEINIHDSHKGLALLI